MEDIKEQLEILKKGAVEIISEAELLEKFEESRKNKRPLRIKLGCDPSTADLHIGHTVLLRKLRQFQEFGHKIIFVIGDGTGRIGDPSGQDTPRKMLTKEQVMKNARTYQEQFSKILDKNRTTVVFNSAWFDRMSFEDVMKLTSHYTVARMLERDDFCERYKKGSQITILEFLYPLMQGYDSVMLEADIEIGGTDQKFNLLVGRSLQKDYGQKPQVVITMPLLVGLDGTKKMSKSIGNTISLTDSSKDMFGKIMSIPDALMEMYFKLLTDTDVKEVEKGFKDIKPGKINPKDIKIKLAKLIVSDYYGRAIADKEAEQFDKVFKKKEMPDEMPVVKIKLSEFKTGKIWVVKLIELSGYIDSKSEIQRLIKQGAIMVNGEKILTSNTDIPLEKDLLVKLGKTKYFKVAIDKN